MFFQIYFTFSESLGNVCLFACLLCWLAPTFFFPNKINLIWLEGRQVSIAIFPRLGTGAQDQRWSTSFTQQGYVSELSVLQALRISGLNDSTAFYWNYIFVETSRVWSLCSCIFLFLEPGILPGITLYIIKRLMRRWIKYLRSHDDKTNMCIFTRHYEFSMHFYTDISIQSAPQASIQTRNTSFRSPEKLHE